MTKHEFDDKRMEEFFDNLLSDDERRQFLSDVGDDDSFVVENLLQTNIDQALRNVFGVFAESDLSANDLQSTENSDKATQPVFALNRRTIGLAIAASILSVMAFGFWQFGKLGRAPFFQPESLAQIYQDSVERGFKPYYECHDMERFKGTFEHRLGKQLTLLPMPDDRRMTGLSYLGGASRSTTAVLFEKAGQPVMVFVDSVENHNPEIIETNANSSLLVFQKERQGLIFYEVSPLGEPAFLDYFGIIDVSK